MSSSFLVGHLQVRLSVLFSSSESELLSQLYLSYFWSTNLFKFAAYFLDSSISFSYSRRSFSWRSFLLWRTFSRLLNSSSSMIFRIIRNYSCTVILQIMSFTLLMRICSMISVAFLWSITSVVFASPSSSSFLSPIVALSVTNCFESVFNSMLLISYSFESAGTSSIDFLASVRFWLSSFIVGLLTLFDEDCCKVRCSWECDFFKVVLPTVLVSFF